MLYDKDIREPLFDFLESAYGKIRILEEKNMGKSRADVVMIAPEALYGIEIKSDADTYERLSRQVKDYNQFYDYNIIVVGTRHAMHVEEHVPDWWGIITVELENGVADFYILRRPKENPKMNWKKKLSLLWRPELAHIQALNEMPKYTQQSKRFVIGKIAERIQRDGEDTKSISGNQTSVTKRRIPEKLLRQQVSEELFQRDYNTIKEELEEYRRFRTAKKRK